MADDQRVPEIGKVWKNYDKGHRCAFPQSRKGVLFNPLDMDITTGMHVIVETARGVELAMLCLA